MCAVSTGANTNPTTVAITTQNSHLGILHLHCIGLWAAGILALIEQICDQLAINNSRGLSYERVSVNVSRCHVYRFSFL